jgi:hypothetical protein
VDVSTLKRAVLDDGQAECPGVAKGFSRSAGRNDRLNNKFGRNFKNLEFYYRIELIKYLPLAVTDTLAAPRCRRFQST